MLGAWDVVCRGRSIVRPGWTWKPLVWEFGEGKVSGTVAEKALDVLDESENH